MKKQKQKTNELAMRAVRSLMQTMSDKVFRLEDENAKLKEQVEQLQGEMMQAEHYAHLMQTESLSLQEQISNFYDESEYDRRGRKLCGHPDSDASLHIFIKMGVEEQSEADSYDYRGCR